MTVETELAALTTATTNLLAAVNQNKAALDTAVATTTADKAVCQSLSSTSLILAANQFGAL